MEQPNNCINIHDICAPKVFNEVKAVVVSAVVVVFVAVVVIVAAAAAAVIAGAVGIVAAVVVIVVHQTGSWPSYNNQPSPLAAFFFQKAEGGIRRVSNQ